MDDSEKALDTLAKIYDSLYIYTIICPLYSIPCCLFAAKVYGYGKSLSPLLWTSWGTCQKLEGYGELGGGSNFGGGDFVRGSHCSTVEKLYAWEKKLYLEVKVFFLIAFHNFQFPLSVRFSPRLILRPRPLSLVLANES